MSKTYYTDELLKVQNELNILINHAQMELEKDIVDMKYEYILEELYELWSEVKWTKEEILYLEKKMK